MNTKRFDSKSSNVWKYVFDFGDAICESVLYRYESFKDRTVLCISVQSGCPVGCKFCGTGKKFIRNLTSEEIIEQVRYILNDMNIDSNKVSKFQIMFMSMGEPFLNYPQVETSIRRLNEIYPNAQLLVSTVGINNKDNLESFMELSKEINKIGLQFSIHETINSKRNLLIPYPNILQLEDIRDYGKRWTEETSRHVYLNYCVHIDNQRVNDFQILMLLFSPISFAFTFSTICSKDEQDKDKGYKDLNRLREISNTFNKKGYNTRVFNPDGQDDIGSGCGQLWYVQKWMKDKIKQKV